MSPSKLADVVEVEVAKTVALVRERLAGVGADQYYDAATDTQKFETMDLDALMQYCEEEALDVVAYGVMLRIRFARLRLAAQTCDRRVAERQSAFATNQEIA